MNRLRILTVAIVCLGVGGLLLPVLSPVGGQAQQPKEALKIIDELKKELAKRQAELEEREKRLEQLDRKFKVLDAEQRELNALAQTGGPEERKDAPTRQEYADMVRMLQEPIETKGLQEKIKFKRALEYLSSQFKGKLVILVDRAGFSVERPDRDIRVERRDDGVDLYDQEVSLPPFPAQMSLNLALRMILAQVEGGRATLAIRSDHLAIVPRGTFVPEAAPPPVAVNPGDEARDIVRMLHQPIETKGLQEKVKLKTALEYFSDKFAGRLPILVDVNAFTEGVAEPVSPYEEEVSLPPVPKSMTMRTALDLILSQVGKGQATYLIRGSHIEITTLKNSTTASFLYRPCIAATFEERPLSAALQTLTDQTGLSIQLDPNLGIKARTTITASFRNSSLEDALVTITEMAELKFVALERSIYVTTPEKAKAIQKEESLRSKKREVEQKKWAPKKVEGAS